VAVAASDCDTHLSDKVFTAHREVIGSAHRCIEIVNSIFHDISVSTGNGGGVLISAGEMTLLVSKSTFVRCRAPVGKGGAMSCTTLAAELREVCAVECAAHNGAFVHGFRRDETLTMTLCSAMGCSGTIGTVHVAQGRMDFQSVNLTRNAQTEHGSGVYNCADDDPDARLIQSTFHNNSDSSTLYRYVSTSTATTERDTVSRCNFVGNGNSEGLVCYTSHENGNIHFNSCCFAGNTGPLFVETGEGIALTLATCRFDGPREAIAARITLHECTFNEKNMATVGNKFLNTGECVSDAGGSGRLSGGAATGMVIGATIAVAALVAGGLFLWYIESVMTTGRIGRSLLLKARSLS